MYILKLLSLIANSLLYMIRIAWAEHYTITIIKFWCELCQMKYGSSHSFVARTFVATFRILPDCVPILKTMEGPEELEF